MRYVYSAAFLRLTTHAHLSRQADKGNIGCGARLGRQAGTTAGGAVQRATKYNLTSAPLTAIPRGRPVDVATDNNLPGE